MEGDPLTGIVTLWRISGIILNRSLAHNIDNYLAADLTVERIGDLVDFDLSTLLANAR